MPLVRAVSECSALIAWGSAPLRKMLEMTVVVQEKALRERAGLLDDVCWFNRGKRVR